MIFHQEQTDVFWIMFSTSFTSLSVFFSIDHHRRLYARFLILFHLTYMKVFSISLSAKVFVSGDFNAHHKDWLTYSGELL